MPLPVHHYQTTECRSSVYSTLFRIREFSSSTLVSFDQNVWFEDGCLLGCSLNFYQTTRHFNPEDSHLRTGRSLNFYQTTRRYNPEDSHLRAGRSLNFYQTTRRCNPEDSHLRTGRSLNFYQTTRRYNPEDSHLRTGRSLNFYQTTRRYNPEDSHLRTHRRENLKSHLKCLVLFLTPSRLIKIDRDHFIIDRS
jgi:hypothetical protein